MSVSANQPLPPGPSGEKARPRPPLVRKPDRLRRLGPVDTGPLTAAVAAISDAAWALENQRKENTYFCFDDTEHMVFRFIPENRDPAHYYSTPAWDIWRPLLDPVMRAAMAPYGFADPQIPKCMLARLAPNGHIDRHVDGAGSHPRTHKIHVPLLTHQGAWFEIDGERCHLAAGEAYEVNNLVPHAAGNEGDRPRVHLIFEIFDAAA